MAKIHRLKSQEHYVWRENTPQLVNAAGEAVRALSLAEEQVIATLLSKAMQKRGSIMQEVELTEPAGKRMTQIEIVVKPGSNGSVQRTIFVDGMLRVTARELIVKKLFAHYGCDVQIQRPNGVFLSMARDPNAVRPAAAASNQTVPNPKNCKCLNWGNPHPGRHHPVCEFNSRAPADEQAIADHDRLYNPDQANMFHRIQREVLKEEEVLVAPPVMSPAVAGVLTRESVQLSNSRAAAKEVRPIDCDCKDWVRPEGADPTEHHPICEHRVAWEAKHPRAAVKTPDRAFLINIETGKSMREASAEEITESLKTEGSLGMRTVALDHKVYAVVMRPGNNDSSTVSPATEA